MAKDVTLPSDWRSAVSNRVTIPRDLPPHQERCLGWWWTGKAGQRIDFIELEAGSLTLATSEFIDMNHPLQLHYLQIIRWWDLYADEDQDSGQNDQTYQTGPTEYREIVVESGGSIDQSYDYLLASP